MSEQEKRFAFTDCLEKLLTYVRMELRAQGYRIALGELYRPPELAALYEKEGKGISNSLHRRGLAIDINLFKDGKYLTMSQDYKILGDYWKSLSNDFYTCCWGGDFQGPLIDGNHFSISHLNVK